MTITERIDELLEKKFREEDFTDCFLVDLNYNPANRKLEVFIDSDTGVTFQTCQQVSRYLEQYIDEGKWLGEKYVLEVSSPGVGRPLKLERQYPRNVGRTVEVKLLHEEKPRKGLLVDVQPGTGIVLEEKVTVEEGKKKRKVLRETEIPFDQIEQTTVKITF